MKISFVFRSWITLTNYIGKFQVGTWPLLWPLYLSGSTCRSNIASPICILVLAANDCFGLATRKWSSFFTPCIILLDIHVNYTLSTDEFNKNACWLFFAGFFFASHDVYRMQHRNFPLNINCTSWWTFYLAVWLISSRLFLLVPWKSVFTLQSFMWWAVT